MTVCSSHVTYVFQSESTLYPCSKQFLDIQATAECGFTLKHIHDKNIQTYEKVHF